MPCGLSQLLIPVTQQLHKLMTSEVRRKGYGKTPTNSCPFYSNYDHRPPSGCVACNLKKIRKSNPRSANSLLFDNSTAFWVRIRVQVSRFDSLRKAPSLFETAKYHSNEHLQYFFCRNIANLRFPTYI